MKLYLVILALACITYSSAYKGEQFSSLLFESIAIERTNKNIVFSPISIQTSLVMALIGAGGNTETEIRHGIDYGTDTKEEVAKSAGELIKNRFHSKQDGPEFRMANRVFVNESINILPEYNNLIEEHFDARTEHLNFLDSNSAANHINDWVQHETYNKIKDLIKPDTLNAVSAVLVNAIYFKGEFENQFDKSSTRKENFALSTSEKVLVEMMHQIYDFKYAELSELDSKAILLPYKQSDLSMLIVLPNRIEGLPDLEKKFQSLNVESVISKMSFKEVIVELPKFNIDFEIKLKDDLSKLGIKSMFTEFADFSGMFSEPHKVDDIVHKAFINVDEFGSEAAASTYIKIVPIAARLEEPKQFRADHPFIFAIVSDKTTFFAGHITTF